MRGFLIVINNYPILGLELIRISKYQNIMTTLTEISESLELDLVDIESLQVCVNLKQITMSARRRIMMALRIPMMMVELILILLMLNCFMSVAV